MDEKKKNQQSLDFDSTPKVVVPKLRVPGGIKTKEVIEATRQAHQMAARSTTRAVPIPSIKGKITERLRNSTPRVGPTDEQLLFRDEGPDVVLRTGTERGVVALALLILENLRRHGGSAVPERELRDLLERLLRSLTRREVMDLEVEAYEVLLWLGTSVNPNIESEELPAPDGTKVPYDPESSKTALIKRAIAEAFDLEMTYYTGGRAEMNHRRITPKSLEAETYLHAFCHRRQDDRVFRISRVGRVWPVRGKVVQGYADPNDYEAADEPLAAQMTLLPSDSGFRSRE